MGLYRYRALAEGGGVRRGRLEAADPAAAEAALRRMGLEPLHCAPHRPLLGRRPIGRAERIELAFQLELMLRAGVPPLEGLEELASAAGSPLLRGLAARLAERVEAGEGLSRALAAEAAPFDPVFVALVAVGERSGRLPEVLRELGEALRWREALAAESRRALLYPLFTLLVVGAVALYLLVAVVPEMAQLTRALGGNDEPPLLLTLAEGVRGHGAAVSGAAAAMVLAAMASVRSEAGRRVWDRALLGLWWVGGVVRGLALARAARHLALTYGSGLPLLEGVALAEGVVGNRAMASALRRVGGAVAEGATLADGLARERLVSPLMVRMVRVGERSGLLEEALGHVAEYHERLARERLERGRLLLEPLLTLLLGALLGGIVLTVLGPLFELIAHLGVAR